MSGCQVARMEPAVFAHQRGLALEHGHVEQETQALGGFEAIVGQDTTLRELLETVRDVAATDSTILLTGETGTGKELVARAIHTLSPRRERAMVKLNCGAMAAGLVESELFGHERGAFTGALQRRIGRVEQADRGTLVLDWIRELPTGGPVQLFRFVQGQELERVGGRHPGRVDVRFGAAPHRDLAAAAPAGRVLA